MIKLHPVPESFHACPYCQVPLGVNNWYIPGMRNLADLECPQCAREFYGDLPASQALYTPLLLDKATGVVHNTYGARWFADWLRDSYANRSNSPVGFKVEEFRPLEQPVLLNCLDTLYGHCLLKLLNAQYYLDHRPEFDLILLIPRFLRWMVPDGVAAIWTVDLPMNRGVEWNVCLAAEIKRRIEPLGVCWLSVAFSHPHPKDYDIERFTRVRPFPIDKWEIHLQQPTITFVWREDRLWHASVTSGNGLLARLMRRSKRHLHPLLLEEQQRKVLAFATALRRQYPAVDFAIAGLGKPGGGPNWLTDLRSTDIDDATERIWCERYASSHIVVGVHGSNMLLPSAHSGAVVELMPPERWGNILQDILSRPQDCRETLFRCRVVPISTGPVELASIISSLLEHHHNLLITMRPEFCDHDLVADIVQRLAIRQQRVRSSRNANILGKETN